MNFEIDLDLDKVELLDRVAELRAKAVAFAESLQDAKTRKALVEDQLSKLSDALVEVSAELSWDNIADAIIDAAESAEEALEGLLAKLDEAGV